MSYVDWTCFCKHKEFKKIENNKKPLHFNRGDIYGHFNKGDCGWKRHSKFQEENIMYKISNMAQWMAILFLS